MRTLRIPCPARQRENPLAFPLTLNPVAMSRPFSLVRSTACVRLPSVLLLCASAVAAEAQATAPAPAAPAVVTKATLDFGYVQTSGNTQVTTLNLGEKLTQQRGRLTLQQGFAVVYGKQQDSVITNYIGANLRGDFKIDKVLAIFVGGNFDRNTFAGLERRIEQQLGIQARLFAGAMDTLRVEGGGSLTQQLGTDGVKQDFPAARGAAAWRHGFTPAAYFQQNVEFIPNLKVTEDWRMNSESSVVAPISSNIGLKLSYVVRFDNLPQAGFSELDKLFTTGVQITFE